jgi:uncharacterized NAD-dependent epimerase/dehydratase family protein
MITTDIVIVDSGVNTEHSSLKETSVQGIKMSLIQENIEISNDFNDEYGHGTAVYNIIRKHSPEANILNIKLFSDVDLVPVEEDELIAVLRYIKENISCKVINLSLGLKLCNDIESLRKICSDIVMSGTIIVAAFDNDGCYSFPAAFDTVIGVDSSYECKNAFDFEVVEGSPINIRAKGGLQRVAWNMGRNIVLGGSSFACAYVSSYIANITRDKMLTLDEILKNIKSNSRFIYPENIYENKIYNKFFDIKCAAVFPFNKEMHSLIRFSKKLNFDIKGVYDIRQSGRIGASAKKLLKSLETDYEPDFIIKDIQNIDYESVDTIIIGHVDELNRMLKKDVRKEIILQAMKHNINIFSFDPLDYCDEIFENSSVKVFYPKIDIEDIPQNTFGKLYNITKPVLAIFGTSSKQGKFSLQITLKHLLEEANYKIGTIGSEPQSILFGMDYVYPMGYNSTVYGINEIQSIILLNNLVHNLCSNEMILISSQANSIPYNSMNVSAIPTKQHSFLLGAQPDAIVLCVNPYDDIEYVANTIKYLEGSVNCKVIAIVMFPMLAPNDWKGMFELKMKISDEDFNSIADGINENIKLPIYKLGEKIDMINLCDLVINFF